MVINHYRTRRLEPGSYQLCSQRLTRILTATIFLLKSTCPRGARPLLSAPLFVLCLSSTVQYQFPIPFDYFDDVISSRDFIPCFITNHVIVQTSLSETMVRWCEGEWTKGCSLPMTISEEESNSFCAVTWSLVLQTRNLANKIVEFWKCDDFSGEISSAHRYHSMYSLRDEIVHMTLID
jgi:hypothetical protein